jgi:hypothetical protein
MGKKGKETNGWFVGYAPRRNPEIVVAAVIQGSSEHGGTTAGPVVRDIVKAYYDKKSGQKDQRYTTKVTRPEILPASANSPTLANGQPGLGPDAGRTEPGSAKSKATR